ncbi:FAD-dependent oxidoreductase [Aquabacterium sp. A7-Y]|uniref:FAD-dependent oxidoreductase n=1 Tax=Aquabacterium sp. A7-Y TaxID=1349605 RepID=UPI00223E2ED7|nr:FAD-dependent oxidoreductase [Aquabacterium sp. A7-Y]MCW7536375.1 FAD-dependent oxidoreductase [Aquabacterium sp. A7-Y]
MLVFSHLRWDFVYQRPQHLLSRLAVQYRVLFVEEPVHEEGAPRLQSFHPCEGVEVLRPHTPVDAAGFHDDQLSVLKPLVQQHIEAHGIADYLVWFYTPMALPLLTGLQPRAVIYDCMDELSAFKFAPRQMRQRESALMKTADLVITGGPSLYEAKRGQNPHLHCFPSSVDAGHFAPATAGRSPEANAAHALHANIPAPRLGFFGVIDERLDAPLVAALADARPDWQLVMAGPVVKIDPAQLPQRPNIHWLGQQPYERLPALVAGWDVCLLPFALNESTRFISPTKTLEYMAAEKPVVSTPIRDVTGLYGEHVRVGHDPASFIAACADALAESEAERSVRVEVMRACVASTSWDATARAIGALIDAALHRRASRQPASTGAAPGTTAPAVPLAPGSGASQAPALRSVRHVVIGAGPTGLSAAYHLGADTVLIEREDRVGGWCRSIRDQGFTFDHAGHILFSQDPYVLEMYDTLLGDNLHWQNREAWIYSKQVYTRYPFQGSLYGLPPEVLQECLVGAIEARFGPLKGGAASPPTDSAPPANFEEFIYRVWGAGIARHFAVPYNRKLWAVPLSEMETSWLGGRVPLPDLEQMIAGALQPSPPPMGPNARFGYPLRGGFQALMDAFLPHLQAELSLNTRVVQVSPSQRLVRLDDGRTLQYETLISTMALPQLVAACGPEAPAEVKAAAAGLRHVSVRCVNLGVAREALTDKHWIYYPEDTVFHRIFVQGNASPHCNPPGGFGLTCEITHSASKPLPCEGQALIDRVVDDCRRVGMLREDDRLICSHQVDMPGAYVVYDHARAGHVARIRDWLAGHGIVLAGRYSEWEYYNSDHAFLAGRRAAEQAQAQAAGTAASVVRAGSAA